VDEDGGNGGRGESNGAGQAARLRHDVVEQDADSMIPDSIIVRPSLSSVEWDSAQFGFPVGQISGADIPEATLTQLLQQAREIGLRLVYWFGADSISSGSALLSQFRGALITRKATFVRKNLDPLSAPECRTATGVCITEYPPSPPPSELIELGFAAGTESRFRVDPLFPRATFVQLYSTWVRRSTLREIADVVLVAQQAQNGIVGFVTAAKQEQGVGVIGLIAVAESVRGRGAGGRLLAAAHEWMIGQGLASARVVTQMSNRAACRFYERNGYSLAHVENVYHFWPQFDGAGEYLNAP